MNNILFCIDVYTVAEGDTLYSIAEKYDLPVSLLMKVNGIRDPYNLLVGTRLCIPGDVSQLPESMRPTTLPEVQPRKQEDEMREHVRREAEREQKATDEPERMDAATQQNQLFELLRQVMGQQQSEQLQKAIRTEPRLQEDARSQNRPEPSPAPAPVSAPAPAPAPAPKPKTHTVKAGDTLYLIARMHNIKLKDLMDANPDIDPYNLMIGSVLRLPY